MLKVANPNQENHLKAIKAVGIDLGKSSFHLIGRESHEQSVFRKKLSRQKLLEFIVKLPACSVAFEAYGGAHWLARFCSSCGHQVKLIPPCYVKPYVKGNKANFVDVEAIVEASGRPGMRFVTVKSETATLLADMARVTKVGGKVSVSSWAPKEQNPWATAATGGVGKHVEVPQPQADAPGIFRYPNPDELKKDMEAAGLKNVGITPASGIFELESAELYWAYMSEIAAPIVMALSGTDEATRAKVGESVKELASEFEKDGKIVFPWNSWVVSGEK